MLNLPDTHTPQRKKILNLRQGLYSSIIVTPKEEHANITKPFVLMACENDDGMSLWNAIEHLAQTIMQQENIISEMGAQWIELSDGQQEIGSLVTCLVSMPGWDNPQPVADLILKMSNPDTSIDTLHHN